MPRSAELSWTVIGYLRSASFVGLGDASLFDRWPEPRSYDTGLHRAPSGLAMLIGKAETDGLPVEIGIIDEVICAARVEFTTDLAELEVAGEGLWQQIGLTHCAAAAVIDLHARGRDDLRVDIPLPPGLYSAERFVCDDDVIGLRLVREDLA